MSASTYVGGQMTNVVLCETCVYACHTHTVHMPHYACCSRLWQVVSLQFTHSGTAKIYTLANFQPLNWSCSYARFSRRVSMGVCKNECAKVVLVISSCLMRKLDVLGGLQVCLHVRALPVQSQSPHAFSITSAVCTSCVLSSRHGMAVLLP